MYVLLKEQAPGNYFIDPLIIIVCTYRTSVTQNPTFISPQLFQQKIVLRLVICGMSSNITIYKIIINSTCANRVQGCVFFRRNNGQFFIVAESSLRLDTKCSLWNFATFIRVNDSMVEYFTIHKCSNKLFNTLQFVLGIKVDNTFPKQYVDVKKLIFHEKTM